MDKPDIKPLTPEQKAAMQKIDAIAAHYEREKRKGDKERRAAIDRSGVLAIESDVKLPYDYMVDIKTRMDDEPTCEKAHQRHHMWVDRVLKEPDLTARITDMAQEGSRGVQRRGYFKAKLDGKPVMLLRGEIEGYSNAHVLMMYDRLRTENPKILEALPVIHGTAMQNGTRYLVMEDMSVGAQRADKASAVAERFVKDFGEHLGPGVASALLKTGMDQDRSSFESDYSFVNDQTGAVRIAVPYRASSFSTRIDDLFQTVENNPAMAAANPESVMERMRYNITSSEASLSAYRSGFVLAYSFAQGADAKAFAKEWPPQTYKTATGKNDKGETVLLAQRKDKGFIDIDRTGITTHPQGATDMQALELSRRNINFEEASISGPLGIGANKKLVNRKLDTYRFEEEIAAERQKLKALETQQRNMELDAESLEAAPGMGKRVEEGRTMRTSERFP